jgi:hypothetical protein
MNRLQRLIQLNAKTSAMVNLAYGPDDDPYNQQRSGFGTAAEVGTGGALAAGGLYAAGARGAGLTVGQTAEKLGQNIGSIGRGGIGDAGRTIGRGAGVAGDAIKNLLAKARGGFARTAATALSSRLERLIQLRAKTESVIQFERDEQDPRYVARAFLGTPIITAINARPGQKLKGFGHSAGHFYKETGKGLGIGAAAGAGIGAAAGVLSKGKIRPGQAAGLGAFYGGALGGDVGAFKGLFDKRSTEIMHRYQ